MIVLDIETSGLNTGKCGIWQIGAVDMETGQEFLEEARIDEEDIVQEDALKITGKTEEELRDGNKKSQKQLIENFLKWLEQFEERIIAGENVDWDIYFIQNKCFSYGIHKKFMDVMGFRGIDLHTIASLAYKDKNKKFKLKDGKSDMSLSKILEMCGLKAERREVKEGKIVREGKPHNALEDCKLEAECFRKLLK